MSFSIGDTVELHEFITMTLDQIQLGVQAAIASVRTRAGSGAINPVWGSANDIGPEHLQKVEFNVAVTVIETLSGSLEGGIKVAGLGLSGKGSGESESTYISRIKFTVPVVLPVEIVEHAGATLSRAPAVSRPATGGPEVSTLAR
jgi:hypothetical protein